MRLKLLALLFGLCLCGSVEAASPKISFWVSTFFTDGTYANFLAISGHTTEGDHTGALNSPMPSGAFTQLTVVTFDPGSPGWTRTGTLFKNNAPTSATCTIPNGQATCTWTGNILFADGDLATIRITGGGGILIKAPWSIMTVFSVGSHRDWPFTA